MTKQAPTDAQMLAKLNRDIASFNRAVTDLVDVAEMIVERKPSMAGHAQRMVREADAAIKQFNPDCGLRVVIAVNPAGTATWSVIRY